MNIVITLLNSKYFVIQSQVSELTKVAMNFNYLTDYKNYSQYKNKILYSIFLICINFYSFYFFREQLFFKYCVAFSKTILKTNCLLYKKFKRFIRYLSYEFKILSFTIQKLKFFKFYKLQNQF